MILDGIAIPPLFQIARRSLITPTMCRTNPRSGHHAKTESNFEQPGKEAGPMMGITDSVKRLQEAGLCSSP